MKESKIPKAIQIKITLEGVQPPVWRRLLIKDDITLNQLHYNIQAAMSWTNTHLHEFEVHGQTYAAPSEYDEIKIEDAEKTDIKLSALNLAEGDKILYTYDFGDDWRHQILIEKITPVDSNQVYPCCIKAVRVCPPEDCGGHWGYVDLIKQLADKSHPEHEDAVELLGSDFDPEQVSLEDINKELHSKPLDMLNDLDILNVLNELENL